MYCPQCNRNLDNDQLESKNKELKEKFGLDSLEKGVCPVCGTKLIDIRKK
ncbi:hypothetical protein [Candidatus Methanomassiliicoccus intestinalis]|uniref:Uncharacterized protein n=1 Tax=Methanomassiliicoccus intestinalis (strain Issoire-Mx1) TaxID=1295009 RepID=U5Q2A0_METII|nr:hypothetical protein [Candidatus Methanomassiliicoccus intestinalis]AGY50163.1 hypothetical protein MMINT_05550 [Candidatus Methanomassiliicoccus intestinalis Issoire-Mx1]